MGGGAYGNSKHGVSLSSLASFVWYIILFRV